MRADRRQVGLFDDPGPPPAPAAPKALGHRLRYYQRDCDAATVACLEESQSALVVMATGLGKSVCFATRAAETRGRVLVLAHRDELLQQAIGHLERATGGEWVELEQADLRAGKGRLVVASIQSIYKDARLARFKPSDFELVIVDEAHRAVTPTYQKVLKHFMEGGTKVVGYTATPNRHDEKALGTIFGEVPYVMGIGHGVRDGWLVRPRAELVNIEDIQLENVPISHGDFARGALDDEMAKGLAGIVDKTLELHPNRTAIGAFAGRRSAQLACELFNDRRPGSACYVDGETDRDERRYLVEGFRRGEFRYLCQVGIAIEGFDAPVADMILQCRPTKSLGLYTQLIGRATRPEAGVLDPYPEKGQRDQRLAAIARSAKPDMLILDFVGTAAYHKLRLVTAASALGGDYDEKVVERARRKAAAQPGADQLDILEEAQAEIEAENLAALARRNRTKKVSARIRELDPFDELDIDERALDQTDQRYGQKPATEGQRRALRNFGIDNPEQLSKRKAKALLDKLIARIGEGKASLKQIAIIRRHVPCPEDLQQSVAREALDYLSKHRWGRGRGFSPHRLGEILGQEREPGSDDDAW